MFFVLSVTTVHVYVCVHRLKCVLYLQSEYVPGVTRLLTKEEVERDLRSVHPPERE